MNLIISPFGLKSFFALDKDFPQISFLYMFSPILLFYIFCYVMLRDTHLKLLLYLLLKQENM